MNNECWLEMDLYWFQGAPLRKLVDDLFDRLTPMWMRAPDARKGLTLCVGWIPDSVLLWNGNPDDIIFTCRPPTYEVWSYRRLSELVSALKRTSEERGINDFHVGLILVGGVGAREDAPVRQKTDGWGGRTEEVKEQAKYHHVGRWFHNHPEVADPRFSMPYFFGAKVCVPGDEKIFHGEEQPVLAEYFACKFSDMARFAGFDALVIRDNFMSPEYRRGGEASRYMDPANRQEWNQSCLEFARQLKRQMPDLILIGYHSGTSPVEEWRCHGFDLEALARTGHLDIWITQTWASAWQDYWPCHSMGYTFQLSAMLVQAAMLTDTKCKHLFLIETFDAWEPWDSIRQYPSKLAWQIWAYSHVTVRKPDGGLKNPDGFYCSWMNRGQELLPPESVDFLVKNLSVSSADLAKKPVPGGPCLIYHRKGLEALLDNPAEYCRGEAMDDWIAMLQKYGLPVLSITRSEWMGSVEADAFIFPAPAAIDPVLADELLGRLRCGTPVLWMGQASLLPEGIRNELEISVLPSPETSSFPSAGNLNDMSLAESVGTRGLTINQRQRTFEESRSWENIISCLGGPVFSRHKTLPAWIWETPEWGTPEELHLSVQSVQSLQTYLAVSSAFAESGFGKERIKWRNRQWCKPVCFLFWRYASGRIGVLLGNLETGLTGNSQFFGHGSLHHAGEMRIIGNLTDSAPALVSAEKNCCRIGLGPHKSCVLEIESVV